MGKSFREMLDFAIQQEEEAVSFYTDLATRVSDASVKKTLLDFAQQERGHKVKLEQVKARGSAVSGPTAVRDMQLSDYLVDVVPKAEMTFQEALILAMKKEKAAYRMYTDMAARAEDQEARKTFLFLAQEEAAHKLSFELEYDDLVYQEN